jgi:DNA-binding beta-propeller fold protein YncE
MGVAVDASGNVYVVDQANQRVQKFEPDGDFITKWGEDFNYPTGVAVDASGNVYVVDSDSSRIQKFSSSGTFITKWGSRGTGEGQFEWASSVAVDPSGNVYVTDLNYHRVQKFTSSGTFITEWGTQGTGDGQFQRPEGIATDTSGNVYVADANNNRIQKFTSSGTFITEWGTQGTDDGQFQGPMGVAVDASGNVYVVDQGNNRIQKFALPPPDTTAPRVSLPQPTGTGIDRATNITANFSEEIDPNSLDDTTFKLFRVLSDGTTKQIMPVTVAPGVFWPSVTLDPYGPLLLPTTKLLAANAKYKAVITTRVKDLAGNRLDQKPAVDGLQQKTWTFKTGST